jgi:hypothetical protein
MITRFLNKNIGPLVRTSLIGSAFLCFLLPAAGFSEVARLHLSNAQSLLGLGIVIGLTLQGMILLVAIALLEKLFVKDPIQHDHETA